MSGFLEMTASSIAKLVAGKLGEVAWEEVKLLCRTKEDVEEMKSGMDRLVAVMRDADSRSRRQDGDGEVVRLWLRNVKSVAYDIDDVLDVIAAHVLIQKHAQGIWKVILFFSCHNPLLFCFTMAHKIKKLREELKKILEDQPNGLKHVANVTGSNESTKEESFAPTNCDIGMVGRDTVKEKIMSMLSQTEGMPDISIIPIIGLPGLGKTTLAQAVFADKRTTNFTVRAWVDVSQNFDLKRIGKAIISKVDQNINLDNHTLQFITNELQKVLDTGRYLIVLDNLWEDNGDNLEKLKQMLQYGAKGSKIILTTHLESILLKLRTGVLAHQRKIYPMDPIRLGFLSPDECWTVIQQRAFGPEDDQSGLEGIGIEIAHKCGGIPLVANALGYIMCQEKSIDAWSNIRDEAVLDLKEHNESTILDCLMLSYYYMLPYMKLCFTYCAVFPMGFIVDSNHLIQQWSALGYIQAKDGERCINYLLGMSFLHISKSSLMTPNQAKAPQKLSMHNLIYELARKVSAHEFLVLDATAPNEVETNYCRHAQLVNYGEQPKVLKEVPSKVRSLHFRGCLKTQFPKKAFSRCNYLRVLDLSGCSIVEQSTPNNTVLPSSISQLELLRYLDASGLPIATLPNSFHTLQNMRSLILSNSSLEALPDHIDRLLELCYFDLSGSTKLHKLPTSFGNLSKLSFLNLSRCSNLENLPKSIDELKCLLHLDMSQCCTLQKLPENFGSLHELRFLDLSGCSRLTKLPDDLQLQALLHLDLSGCHVLGGLPESFGNLCKLEMLNLSECYQFQMLPNSFCQLENLKDLDLSDCHELKELPGCFGNLCGLRSLKLTSCSKMQGLPESIGNLLKLKHLNLSFCIKLEELPASFGDLRLEMLDLDHCWLLHSLPAGTRNMTSLSYFTAVAVEVEKIEEHLNLPRPVVHSVHSGGICSSIVELEKMTNCFSLYIQGIEKVTNSEDAERAQLCNISDLRLLRLYWDPESSRLDTHATGIREKDKLVLEKLIPPPTLELFTLIGYMSRDFPKWMSNISLFLPCLVHLALFNLRTCDCLPPFGKLPNLRALYLFQMPGIRRIGREFYGDQGTCQKLRMILMVAMENLEVCRTTRSGDENEEFLIPNLHFLHIQDCPKLKFLPYPPRSILWSLRNADEVLPAQGFGRLSSFTSPYSMLFVDCSFSSDKWERLQYFSSLSQLKLKKCRGMTLPQVVQSLTSLEYLKLEYCADLETVPEWLGHLVSLKIIIIRGCPKLTSLPESIQNITTWEREGPSTSQVHHGDQHSQGDDSERISDRYEV